METMAIQIRIPFVDLGAAGPAALADSHRESAEALLLAGRRLVPYPFLPALDKVSRRWAHKARNPHLAEIAAMSAVLPTGVWFMNLCFEWGCTTGVAPDPDGAGMRMLRTLDWPFHGIGRHVVVARQTAPAGDYLNVTWPGFVGVVTAMAPGRFALAINQAPLVRRGYLPLPGDWLANRVAVFRSRELPPVHLARQVMETCRNYDEARETLMRTPLALPAFFALAGVEAGDGCVIERTETRAWSHPAPAATANHWLSDGLRGRPRGADSPGRLRLMYDLCGVPTNGFDWLIDPVLNPDTRLAVVANPATGCLAVQGWERDGAVTEVYEHAAAA
jgi:hypothetical protein